MCCHSIRVPARLSVQWAPSPVGLGDACAGSKSPILGFDLNGDGVTPNDPGDGDRGANGLQNYPQLAAATRIAGGTSIVGSLNSTENASFRVEFYSNTVGPDFRAGERFLGFTDVTTDAAGNATFVTGSPIVLGPDEFVPATATRLFDFDHNRTAPPVPLATSEFSAGIAVRQNPWYNAAQPLDVSGDTFVVPLDALLIINYLNRTGGGAVPSDVLLGPDFPDTSGDGFVTPLDALLVINFINAFDADSEGEVFALLPQDSPPTIATGPVSLLPNDELLTLLAADNGRNPSGGEASCATSIFSLGAATDHCENEDGNDMPLAQADNCGSVNAVWWDRHRQRRNARL